MCARGSLVKQFFTWGNVYLQVSKVCQYLKLQTEPLYSIMLTFICLPLCSNYASVIRQAIALHAYQTGGGCGVSTLTY